MTRYTVNTQVGLIHIITIHYRCWNIHSPRNGYFWILQGPVIATLLVSILYGSFFYFYVNILTNFVYRLHLWPLYYLSIFDVLLQITSLISFGHCIIYPSSTYGFRLPLWYLLAIVLSVHLRRTASDYLSGICWPLYYLSFFDVRLQITPLVYVGHCIICPSSTYGFRLPLWYLLAIVLSVLLRRTASDYLSGIFWPLYYLSIVDVRLQITSLVYCGHCIICPSSTYGFRLPLWYLVAIVLSVHLRRTASDYLSGIFWPLYYLSIFDVRLQITSLVYVGHCIICPSSTYDFRLPL